jgi:hypothetical protein
VSTDPDVPLASWGAKARLVFLVTFPISLAIRILPSVFGWDELDYVPWVPFRVALSTVVIVSGAVWMAALHRRASAIRNRPNPGHPSSR